MKLSHQSLLASAAGVVAVLLCLLGGVTPVAAGPDETTDLAAMYIHLPIGIPGVATGPYSTVFYVSNTTSASTTVVIKCYNSTFDRVGPAGGTIVSLGAFDVDIFNPVSLGLTTSPFFDGVGWCYFARTVGDDFAVAFALGIQGTNPAGPPLFHPIFTSNATVAIATGTGQASISDEDGNAPLWVGGSNWATFLIAVNPTTTTFGTLVVNVYGTGGNFLGTASDTLSPRDLDVYTLSGFGGTDGTADVGRAASPFVRGYMGWVLGLNLVSLESFLYNLPLDKDDVATAGPLGGPDRP
jgi:hypothetical protein